MHQQSQQANIYNMLILLLYLVVNFCDFLFRHVSKTVALGRAGSIPAFGTKKSEGLDLSGQVLFFCRKRGLQSATHFFIVKAAVSA
jgi:hypothetical protein